ncbi:MAG: PAS domain S-box protein [Phycisphaerae bacterium]|nr:PAS domain S-box protein [Phycisphaerae bacterium]
MIQNDDGHKCEPRSRRSSLPAKPVQRRLLIPLAAVVLLLVSSFGAILLSLHQRYLNQFNQHLLEHTSKELAESLVEQSDALAALEEVILRDEDLRDALKARDRQRLLTGCESIFAQLREKHNITHFCFHLPDRVNLLRMHKPGQNGDLINRFTALEAERTGETVSGVELGSLGTFTLRVVRPVFDGDTLIGYMELGEEIEDILAGIRGEWSFELAVTIHKTSLDRAKWETGMAMLGRESDWDRYSNEVLIYCSLPRFPPECDHFISEEAHDYCDVTAEAEFDGKSWRVLLSPLEDVSGAQVGDLIILSDVSEANAAFHRLLVVASGGVLVLLVVLLGFLYVVLQRTDRSIRAQQADLQKSEAFQRALSETSPDFIFILDRDGTIRQVNRTYPVHRREDVVGHSVLNFIRPEDRDEYQAALRRAAETWEMTTVEVAVDFPDGERRFFLTRLNPVSQIGNGGRIVQIATDITDHKRAQEAIKESEEGLRITLASIGDGVIATDTERRITRLNKVAEELTGWTARDARGKALEEVFHIINEQTRAPARDPVARALAFGRIEGLANHTVLVARDGAERAIADSAAPIRGVNGQIVGVVLVFRDVTEDRQHQKEKEQLLHDLDERVRELQCLYGVARSIRQRETLEEVFLDVVALIPPGWGCPEITRARIVFDGAEYVSEPFDETKWKQSSDIVVGGVSRGVVEVYYLEDRPHLDEGPFLREERSLIDSLARTLGEAIERKQAEEELRRFNRQAVGREERMIELKREVNEMTRKAGAAPPYNLAFAESGKGGTDDEG